MLLENRLWMMTWRSLFFLRRQPWQGLDAHDISGTMAPLQTLWIRGCTIGKLEGSPHPTCSDSSKSPGQKKQMAKKKRTNQRKKPHKKLRKFNNFVRSIRSNSLTSCEGPVLSNSVHLGSGFFPFLPLKSVSKIP